jgi:hypothetical protein
MYPGKGHLSGTHGQSRVSSSAGSSLGLTVDLGVLAGLKEVFEGEFAVAWADVSGEFECHVCHV